MKTGEVHSRPRIALVPETRPEPIQLAPSLGGRAKADACKVHLINSGQHRETTWEALVAFDLKADVDLGIMRTKQTPADVLA